MSIYVVQLAILTLAAGFAFWKGGPAERSGAILMVLASAAMAVVQKLTPLSADPVAFLAIDGLYGLGLLWLAIRHMSRWLGVSVLLQACLFVMESSYFVEGRAPDYQYAVWNNLLTMAVWACLVVATALGMVRRPRRSLAERLASDGEEEEAGGQYSEEPARRVAEGVFHRVVG